MRKYLITYNLKNEAKDYATLYQAIKNISGLWWHYFDSTWIVKTDKSPTDIFSELRPHIDEKKDKLLVIEIDVDNKQGWLPIKAWDWLNG